LGVAGFFAFLYLLDKVFPRNSRRARWLVKAICLFLILVAFQFIFFGFNSLLRLNDTVKTETYRPQSKNAALPKLQIEGNYACRSEVKRGLRLLEEKSNEDYALVAKYTGLILCTGESPDCDGAQMEYYKTPPTIHICHLPDVFTTHAQTMAFILVHEACHAWESVEFKNYDVYGKAKDFNAYYQSNTGSEEGRCTYRDYKTFVKVDTWEAFLNFFRKDYWVENVSANSTSTVTYLPALPDPSVQPIKIAGDYDCRHDASLALRFLEKGSRDYYHFVSQNIQLITCSAVSDKMFADENPPRYQMAHAWGAENPGSQSANIVVGACSADRSHTKMSAEEIAKDCDNYFQKYFSVIVSPRQSFEYLASRVLNFLVWCFWGFRM